MSSLSFVLLALCFRRLDACDTLKVKSSSSALSFLSDTTFKLNPTLLADGRPVYEEVGDDGQAKRLIHHYSHDRNGNGDTVDYSNIDFNGRWIIGASIENGNGWAYLSSWSIEPSKDLIKSYINADLILNTPTYQKDQDENQINTLQSKDKWNVYLDGRWRRASYEELSVSCDYSDSTDDLLDWLFVTFRNDTTVSWFRTNVTSDFNLNLHGFFYRIIPGFYRKIDSNIFLDASDRSASGRMRFFAYFGYTDANGIPLYSDASSAEPAGVIDPIQLVAEVPPQNGVFPTSWSLVRNTTQSADAADAANAGDAAEKEVKGGVETLFEEVGLEVLTRSQADESIYDVMRNYYNEKKKLSFSLGVQASLRKSGLISTPASGGFLSKFVGGGGTGEMSEEDGKMVKSVENKIVGTLNNGMEFAWVGFGTGGLGGFEANRRLVEAAVEIGYRVVDSASAYDSETAIGDFVYSLQNDGSGTMTRDDLFVTTKVWPTNLGFIETQTDLYQSLDKMNSNYIDLYMIHWPRCMQHFSWMDCTQASGKTYLQTWQLMEKMYAEGRILSLGVSNWDFRLWEELTQSNQCQIIPQVVQNYFDIQHQDWELLEYLESWGAVFQGYATYRGVAQADQRAQSEPYYLEWRKNLNEIAGRKSEESGKTVTGAQVLLKWLTEANVAVIPRSHNVEHISDNWNLWGFDLTHDEYDSLTKKSWDEVKKRLKQEL